MKKITTTSLNIAYLALIVSASLSTQVFAAASPNISHSYSSSQTIKKGSLVSVEASNSDAVDLSNPSNAARLLGVTVQSDDSLVAIDSGPNTVQVATNGLVNVLVSNINGNIKSGDQVSVSDIEGVGMEAAPGTHVIGIAASAFTGNASGDVTEQIKNKNGQDTSVKIGYIPLNIAVGTVADNQDKYTGLEKLAVQLTGHTIPIARIIIALVVAVIAIVQLFASTYVAIYGSIVAIGRNPLAKKAILQALTSVIIATLMTAAVASVAIVLLIG